MIRSPAAEWRNPFLVGDCSILTGESVETVMKRARGAPRCRSRILSFLDRAAEVCPGWLGVSGPEDFNGFTVYVAPEVLALCQGAEAWVSLAEPGAAMWLVDPGCDIEALEVTGCTVATVTGEPRNLTLSMERDLVTPLFSRKPFLCGMIGWEPSLSDCLPDFLSRNELFGKSLSVADCLRFSRKLARFNWNG